jgi:hypothetical protein
MSIVVLKRKTGATIKNNSAGMKNFSLNGTRRSQGWVGQDMMGRSLPKTILKGTTPKGHGGCCGRYTRGTIVKSITNLNCLNNPAVIKASVLGNKGMLATKYRWIRRPQPFTTSKPDSSASQYSHTQGQYITHISKNALASANNSICQKFKYIPTSCPRLFRTDANAQISQITSECGRYTKDITNSVETPKGGVAMESGLYIQKLEKKCGLLDEMTYPRSSHGGPLPGN